MLSIEVVYENGVFKPLEQVPLRDGEKARILISVAPPNCSGDGGPSDYAKRLAVAKTIQEKIEIMNSTPSDVPDGYDLLEALNRNRVLSGSLPWFPIDQEAVPHE